MARRTFLVLAMVVALIVPTTTSAALITDAMKGRVIYRALKQTSDPDRAFWRLSYRQRGYVRAYLKPKVVTTHHPRAVATSSASAWGSGCYSQPFVVKAEGILGNDLWSFTQTAYWCWAAGRITSGRFTTRGTVHSLFWEYQGIADRTTWGGPGQLSIGQYTQALFQVCVVMQGVGCVQSAQPWISQEMFARSTGIEDGGR